MILKLTSPPRGSQRRPTRIIQEPQETANHSRQPSPAKPPDWLNPIPPSTVDHLHQSSGTGRCLAYHYFRTGSGGVPKTEVPTWPSSAKAALRRCGGISPGTSESCGQRSIVTRSRNCSGRCNRGGTKSARASGVGRGSAQGRRYNLHRFGEFTRLSVLCISLTSKCLPPFESWNLFF